MAKEFLLMKQKQRLIAMKAADKKKVNGGSSLDVLGTLVVHDNKYVKKMGFSFGV